MCAAGPTSNSDLTLRPEWAPFDLVKVGGEPPKAYRRGDIFIISGCITTTQPMKNQAGWDLTIGSIDQRNAPPQELSFLAPTSMSRYEGIYQCGTSATLKDDGKLSINFGKSTNPMVLHLTGLCCNVSNEEPIPIPIAHYELRDWFSQFAKARSNSQILPTAGLDDSARTLEAEESNPPALRRCGNIVFLQGELKEATFGPISQHVGTIPEGLRPRRELRFLAALLRQGERLIDHSMALTIKPDGTISVQGGKVHMVDAKGNVRMLQQKKRGRLCLDGIRFALVDGEPLKASYHTEKDLTAARPKAEEIDAKNSKVGYLLSAGNESAISACCLRHGDVVLLEGTLTWAGSRQPNAKQPVAVLAPGCWPHRREVFFTRGGSDLEERRRVDIDQYGRIFCPEGASNNRVELTGIIFVAAASEPGLRPRDADWDDLKLQYQRNEVNVVNTSFDGHEILEQFVRRSNYHEWRFIEYDFGRHAGRKMLLPLGQVALRGNDKWDPMNLGAHEYKLWRDYKAPLAEKFGVTTFHTLLHVSDVMFQQVATAAAMRDDDRRYLMDKRQRLRQDWSMKRTPGLTFPHIKGLATEIVEQMFEHWDFKAQLQGALQNDFRAPSTIEHLFPQKRSGQDFFIRKHVQSCDMARFEEARQFFYLYETTGSNMTHCSLMGATDVFTTTGKWFFPDAPDVQKQLFSHIEWLFPRKVYLYISERQTPRFPFIEDLDIQAAPDWQGELGPGQKRVPPDDLIMKKPQRINGQVVGDPGELMIRRAHAIHMIYPHLDHLECLVYSASGYNKGKDLLKSSFHLVWRQLIVDADRAPVIRHVTLGLFAKETRRTGSFLNHLQSRLIQLDASNNWELVFDSTTINARNGLRLPYSDKASMVIESEEDKRKVKEGTLSKTKAFKKRVKEDRPSIAIGKIRFEFDKDPETGNDIMSSANWVADQESYPIAEWIAMGSCRRDQNSAVQVELTPWQLGPDVLSMLPTKPGEQFYFEGEADGEGGHWVTHKPFPQVRRCAMEPSEFIMQFNESLSDEQDALKEEQHFDLLRRTVGSWVSVTEKQAMWHACAATQSEAKVPDRVWGTRKIQRPAEVVYLKNRGKVVVDGPPDVVEALLRALKTFTKPDDNAVMPIYDLAKIS